MNDQTKITSLAVLYAGLLGVCYLEGFWNIFNINVFQYADLMDVIKATVLPLLLILFAVALGFLSSLSFHIVTPDPVPLPVPPPLTIKIFIFIRTYKGIIFTLWVSAGIVAYFTLSPPQKWEAMSIFSFPFGLMVANTKFITSISNRIGFRGVLGVVFVSLPFVSLEYGSTAAINITRGLEKYSVDVSGLTFPKTMHPPVSLEYVGFVGSSFFLYDPSSKGLVVIKQSDSTVLSLIPNPAAPHTSE